MKKPILFVAVAAFLASCSIKTVEIQPNNLVFKFIFDSVQPRLSNTGQPQEVFAGNAAQNPIFDGMSAHYLELSPHNTTPLGAGAIVFRAQETMAGGSKAIDFTQNKVAGNNEVFYKIPLTQVKPGQYEWLRVSLAYQQYKVAYHVDTTISGYKLQADYWGTIASFIGFNTYIPNLKLNQQNIAINGNRQQGFWAFESTAGDAQFAKPVVVTGQSPAGSTTVVNPLFLTSPVPAGSCVVTGEFAQKKLIITGDEDQDIVIEIRVSTNKSFEWKDTNGNQKWDPLKGEPVVDMGIRGIVPKVYGQRH
jgi:hypothetical protein